MKFDFLFTIIFYMQAPFFFLENIDENENIISVSEETSKHIVHVLRMKAGEKILLTDGKGNLFNCKINEANKKRCIVEVRRKEFKEQRAKKISIAISLLKNTNRFEWFLEKATELGIDEIIPSICERTEKQHFRSDRMRNILISAMLQSQQVWLPALKEPTAFKKIMEDSNHLQKFIAHCEQDAKIALGDAINASMSSQIILIGPEGDFTKDEIELAFKNHFMPVSLGETRLRSETAGIAAAVILVAQ